MPDMQHGISLLVGLGNPGFQYEETRHNVGFWLVHKFAELHNCSLKLESKFKGLVGNITVPTTALQSEPRSASLASSRPLHLLLPQTFMNLSGQAVVALAHFYKIPPAAILVVHDELDFMPGVVRFKKGGGANGHNGIQNIIDLLGNKDFYRLRIGIGKPLHKGTLIDYVINKPSHSDQDKIMDGIDAAIKVLPKFIAGDFERATQELHAEVK